MNKKQDPLLSLVAEDAEAVDRTRIAEYLRPYVSIDKDTQNFTFRAAFNALGDNRKKIEVALTAALARSLIFGGTASLEARQIIALQIMPPGSAKTALRDLFRDGRIKKDTRGAYFIPMYQLEELLAA